MDKHIIAKLEKITGKDGVLSTPEDLSVYSYDATFAEHRPDVVVLPRTTEQVSQVVMLAAQEHIPLVTRGMGSGMAAASVPFHGGITLAMTRMNRILEIDGLTRQCINCRRMHIRVACVPERLRAPLVRQHEHDIWLFPLLARRDYRGSGRL